MSKVWEVFSKVASAGDTKAQCSLCQEKLTIRKDGGTSHLKNHINRRHLVKYKQLFPEKKSSTITTTSTANQPTIKEFNMQHQPLKQDAPKAKALTEGILQMLYVDLQPTSFTEDTGFRFMMSKAEPRYQIPSRATFRNILIPNVYKDILAKVKSEVEQHMATNTTISITTDGWTSKTTSSYITYTLHFIREDFSMAAYNIGTFEYRHSHTAEHLRKHIYSALRHIGILQSTAKRDANSDEEREEVVDEIEKESPMDVETEDESEGRNCNTYVLYICLAANNKSIVCNQ